MISNFMLSQKNHAEGRQVILYEDVKKLEKELKGDMYKDADTKYQDMMIKLRVSVGNVMSRNHWLQWWHQGWAWGNYTD